MSRKVLYREYDKEGNLIKLECSKCREIKSVDDFHKDRTMKDGVKRICKECKSNKSKRQIAHREYDENNNLIKLECTNCHEIKTLENFPKNKNYKDGYCNTCKQCMSNASKERYRKNHEMKTLYREYDENNNLIKLECRNCHEIKDVNNYRKNKECIDGVVTTCNQCKSNKAKERYENNKEEILKKHHQYYENNKEKLLEQHKEYRENNKEKISEYHKQRYQENREKILEINHQYYQNNREKELKRGYQYRENNREKVRESNRKSYYKYKEKNIERGRQYYKENKEKIDLKHREYHKNNLERDRERGRQYYIKNKDKRIQYAKENKEKFSRYRRQYYLNNIDKQRNQVYENRKNKINEEIQKIYENITKNLYPNNGIQYGIIYGVHCIPTDRWYIGQTIYSFNHRYNKDFFKYKPYELYEDNSKAQLLQDDIEKYGQENFEIFEVLDVAFSEKELDEKEIYYIDYYKAYDEGYNSNRGNIFKHNKSKRKEVI